MKHVSVKIKQDKPVDAKLKDKPKRPNPVLMAEGYLHQLFKDGDVTFNELNKKLQIRDGEDIENYYILLKQSGIDISKNDLIDLLKVKFAIHYNPVNRYFDELRNKYTYTEVQGSIQDLCSYVKAIDQPLFDSMLRKHLIRCVSQGLMEAVNRFVFVIQQQKQNTGKSSFIRFLNPFGTGELYAEKIPINDPILVLSQSLMVNIDELESFTKKDVDWLKSLISVEADQVRIYYSQVYETRKRIASFWGSTNKIEFLADGENTRWIICEVDKFDFDYNNLKTGVKKVDINKVWAEAVLLYDMRADMLPSAAEWAKLADINKEYVFQNDYDLFVDEFLIKGENDDDFSTLPVISKYLNNYKGVKVSPQKIGVALTKSGYHKTRRFGAGRGYLVRTVEGESITDFIKMQTQSYDPSR